MNTTIPNTSRGGIPIGSAIVPPSECAHVSRPKSRAFSLVEIMVAMGLLSMIVLGLLMMFNQTQRAFRTSITQSDVLEAGRSTMDLISRELSQAAPSQMPDFFLTRGTPFRSTNFFVEPAPFFPEHFLQALPGTPATMLRTNTVQRFFFLSKMNQDWVATGYQVIPSDANSCVGTLYRFSMTNLSRKGPITANRFFAIASLTNMDRIADGVVHFRLVAYAKNGFPILTNSFRGTNAYALGPYGPYTNVANTIGCVDRLGSQQSACYFMSNALPAYVDLELGILEPQVLQRYRSIPVDVAQRDYISNHVAQVHIFRQRIALPNYDPTAYP